MAGRSMSAKIKGVGFWSRLQPRERVLVMALAAVFFAVLTGVLFFLRASKIDRMRTEIDGLKTAIDMVHTRGPTYQAKLANKATREAEIADTPLVFGTIIEAAEAAAEVSVSNQQEKATLPVAEGLRQRTIEFDLKSVTLEQLTMFLASVEAQPGRVVLTQNLLIRSSNGNEDRINAEVELSTWERDPVAAIGVETP
jgi:type II secretory pathway component PulM